MLSRHILVFWFCFCLGGRAAGPDDYLNFVRAQAAEMRKGDEPPESPRQWRRQESALRKELLEAWGGFPKRHAPLRPGIVGSFERDGYRVERLLFQTFPGVWMTANAYVPQASRKAPALLMVHGHWRGAKQDPVVQARCIGAAKLGFFVLAVDAFGAGERGIGRALGEYHGEMTAATLLPAGLPLSGIQVYENMRAVEYLRSRPEVDSRRIGITGASGGGNQSMYAGAWDKRLSAVAPVCSVGNYQAYLGAACCMCEVVPGALRFTEEWQVLGMTAPRALLVINATRDSRQFSVQEAAKSLAFAKPIFNLLETPEKLRHTTFDSGHDYSQPMREAVYGWMTLHLKGQGDGSPLPERAIQTEDPELLRCFPGESRPDDWMTIPKFAAEQSRQILAQTRKKRLSKPEQHQRLTQLLGGFPARSDLSSEWHGSELAFSPEPGIRLTARQIRASDEERILIVLDLDHGIKAIEPNKLGAGISKSGTVVTLDLRATGSLAWPSDRIGRAPDHTTAQWGLWIGRPLIGQWVWDVRRLLDALAQANGKLPSKVEVVGLGPAGLIALATGVLDERITRAAALGTLESYVSEAPYEGQRMGVIIPGILRHFGDIEELRALAP